VSDAAASDKATIVRALADESGQIARQLTATDHKHANAHSQAWRQVVIQLGDVARKKNARLDSLPEILASTGMVRAALDLDESGTALSLSYETLVKVKGELLVPNGLHNLALPGDPTITEP